MMNSFTHRPGDVLRPLSSTSRFLRASHPGLQRAAAVSSHLHLYHPWPGCPAQGDPRGLSPSPHITLGRGYYHSHAEDPATSHSANQGNRKGGSRPSRVDFQNLSPSCCSASLVPVISGHWGLSPPSGAGWQMAAKQGCCVITSLLSSSLA